MVSSVKDLTDNKSFIMQPDDTVYRNPVYKKLWLKNLQAKVWRNIKTTSI